MIRRNIRAIVVDYSHSEEVRRVVVTVACVVMSGDLAPSVVCAVARIVMTGDIVVNSGAWRLASAQSYVDTQAVKRIDRFIRGRKPPVDELVPLANERMDLTRAGDISSLYSEDARIWRAVHQPLALDPARTQRAVSAVGSSRS